MPSLVEKLKGSLAKKAGGIADKLERLRGKSSSLVEKLLGNVTETKERIEEDVAVPAPAPGAVAEIGVPQEGLTKRPTLNEEQKAEVGNRFIKETGSALISVGGEDVALDPFGAMGSLANKAKAIASKKMGELITLKTGGKAVVNSRDFSGKMTGLFEEDYTAMRRRLSGGTLSNSQITSQLANDARSFPIKMEDIVDDAVKAPVSAAAAPQAEGLSIVPLSEKEIGSSKNIISDNTNMQSKGEIQKFTENVSTQNKETGKFTDSIRKKEMFRHKPFAGVPDDLLEKIQIGGGAVLKKEDIKRLGNALQENGYINDNTGLVVKGYVGNDIILATTKAEDFSTEYIVAGINKTTGKIDSIRMHATTITNDQIIGRTSQTLSELSDGGAKNTPLLE